MLVLAVLTTDAEVDDDPPEPLDPVDVAELAELEQAARVSTATATPAAPSRAADRRFLITPPPFRGADREMTFTEVTTDGSGNAFTNGLRPRRARDDPGAAGALLAPGSPVPTGSPGPVHPTSVVWMAHIGHWRVGYVPSTPLVRRPGRARRTAPGPANCTRPGRQYPARRAGGTRWADGRPNTRDRRQPRRHSAGEFQSVADSQSGSPRISHVLTINHDHELDPWDKARYQ